RDGCGMFKKGAHVRSEELGFGEQMTPCARRLCVGDEIGEFSATLPCRDSDVADRITRCQQRVVDGVIDFFAYRYGATDPQHLFGWHIVPQSRDQPGRSLMETAYVRCE